MTSGLGLLFDKVTVGAADSSPEAVDALTHMLMAASPQARLDRIVERAKRHRGADGLRDEIEWIVDRLNASNGQAELVDLFALLSIERGLDLLDSGVYFSELLALRRADKGRAQGIVASAQFRAKLPDADKLEAMIAVETKHNGGNRRAAVGAIAKKYDCKTQAIGIRLRRAKLKAMSETP